jgi:hypothetical protein
MITLKIWAKISKRALFFFKYTFLEPSRGPLSIATIVGKGAIIFDPE